MSSEGKQLDLSKLLNAKRGIESDKITERKKSAVNLQELLQLDHVLDYIDSHSRSRLERSKHERRGGASRSSPTLVVTWSSLFRSVETYIAKETEAIKKAEEKGAASSSIALSNRQTRKKDVAEMLRVFIKASNKKGSHLPLGEILDHMRAMIEGRHTREWTSVDYTHILLDHILPVPQYSLSMSAGRWEDWIAVYCELFFLPIASLDKTLVARAVHILLTHALHQVDISLHSIYTFYSKALSNISEEKNWKLLEELLRGLCLYFTISGANGRSRICNLGEEILPSVLVLWTHCASLKDQIVEFLRIQIRVHHPGGRITEEEGAWARSDVVWKNSLKEMYRLVLTEFESCARLTRRSLSQKPMGKDFEFLDLACDVVYLRLHVKDTNTTQDAPKAKKRRVQSCWSTLNDGLLSSKDVSSTISWLQLVTWLLSKWSSSLPLQEFLPLLSTLQKMLRERESKRVECTTWVLTCLSSLALNPTSLAANTTKHADFSLTRELWKKIWRSTIKLLTVHCSEKEGYNLLTTLLVQDLVEPDLSPWQLFNEALNTPTSSSVSFLACFLSKHPLPESVGFQFAAAPSSLSIPFTLTQNGSSADMHHALRSYPLRSQLIHFLLSNVGTSKRTQSAVGSSIRSQKKPTLEMELSSSIVLLSHVLAALTQRSHSSAQLPFLRHLYHNSSSSYFRELLDHTYHSTHRTSFTSEVVSPGSTLRQDFISEWSEVEKTMLLSTFDDPLVVPCLQRPRDNSDGDKKFSRETTITCLQNLVLQLLGKRSEVLLQPLDTEIIPSPRERSQLLGDVLVNLANHCSVILHFVLLLCQCEAFTQLDQLKTNHAIKTLPKLLKSIEGYLRDPIWNEIEKAYYHQTCTKLLSSLLPLVYFPHLQGKLPPAADKAFSVIRKLCFVMVPDTLLELIGELAKGKWPVSSGLASSSTFSLASSSCSVVHPHVRSMSADFDDTDDDMNLADSGPSTHSDFSTTSSTGPHDMLSISCLSDHSVCQLQAALFLCDVYISWSPVCEEVATAPVSTSGGGTSRKFNVKKAVFDLLSSHDKSKPANIQIAFGIIQKLCECQQLHKADLLECIIEVISEALSVHRKNQTVYRHSLLLLTQILPHFTTCNDDDPTLCEVRKTYVGLVSGFWTLYSDKTLPAAVRVRLADLFSALHAADREGAWSTLKLVKKKQSELQSSSVREVLVMMVNDPDHSVRMHVARVVTSLFTSSLSSECTSSVAALLSHDDQEKTFQQIFEMLQLAFVISNDLDDLSSEDESVNRVASRIYTLLLEACISPACEQKVVSELVVAVGHGQIDPDLVGKAFNQLSLYLGYSSSRQLLETMLPALIQKWRKEGLPLLDFPYSLMKWGSCLEFFMTYAGQLVPQLVFDTDEASLTALAEMFDKPLSDLLKASVPSCMVLILTCWAQEEGSGGSDIRQRATASHQFLCTRLSEEVVGQTLQLSIDEFVIALLLRIFEPHSSKTHLARFCLPSDPEPYSPHYTSHMIRAALDYMPSCYGSSAAGTSFLRLLSRRNDHLQHILLSLAMRIEATHRVFEKRRLLLAYNLFIRLICKELREGGLEEMRAFVIMDVVHTVVRILSIEENDEVSTFSPSVLELFPVCLDILNTICSTVLEACPKELSPHLHAIVGLLIPFARQIRTHHGKQALVLLSNLLDKVSPEAMRALDPFPDTEPFTGLHHKQQDHCQDIPPSLGQKIDQFLSTRDKGYRYIGTESLKCLQKSLHASKFEIPYLLKGSMNPLLRLLHRLVSLCSKSHTTLALTCHVARVLGEIGPGNLRCIALPSTKEDMLGVEIFPGSVDSRTMHIVKLLRFLAMLLLDEDIKVVQASGECLKEILASKTGAGVFSKLEEEMSMESMQWCHYLQPFRPQKRKKSATSAGPTLNSTTFTSMVDVPELWLPTGGGINVSHSAWLTKLVITLLSSGGVSDEVLTMIKPVCTVKVELCEEIFPLIIHNILLSSNGTTFHSVLSRQVRLFFSTVNSIARPSSPILSHPQSSACSGNIHPDSIRTMLNMVMYLRTVDKPKSYRGSIPSTPWDNNFWLDLDFLDVAKAAQRCSAYFTSLLYIEIWHGAADSHSIHSGRGSGDMEDEEIVVAQNLHSSLDEVSDVQTHLLEAYRHIGEPDSLYGACSAHVTNDTTRLLLYEHEGEWHKSLNTHNLLMESPRVSSHVHVAESLHQLGLSHVLKMYLCGVRGVEGGGVKEDEVGEYLYEAAWRCTQWGEESMHGVSVEVQREGYHQKVYKCMTALRDGQMNLLQNSLTEARCHVIRYLCSTGLESTYSLYPSLSKLLCLLELEEASVAHQSTPGHDLAFLQDWKERLLHLSSDFRFIEPVLATRGAILHNLLQVHSLREGTDDVENKREVESLFKALKDTLLTQTVYAREAANYQVCERALFSLRQLQQQCDSLHVSSCLHSSLPWTLKLEEAKLYWARNERTLAIALLKQLLEKLKNIYRSDPNVATLYPASLSLYGGWLAETRSESPSEIIDEYLDKSVTLMKDLNIKDLSSVMEAYLTLARYADNQYRRIERHMESGAFEAKRQLLHKSKLELQNIESNMSPEARQRNRHVRTLQTQSQEDESVVLGLQEEKQLFLEKALRNYMLCLQTGDAHDLRIFRLCGLWFANSNSAVINKIMKENVSRLESFKFVPLMYQLAARISFKSSLFQQVLQEVIFRTTLDHPHQCLYILLALSNASKDDQFPRTGYVTGKNVSGPGSKLSRKSLAASSVDEDKVKAAKNLITKLRSKKPSLVKSAEQLCEAYVDLAYYDVTAFKTQRGHIKLPSTCPLLKIKGGNVPVPTIELAVDRTCSYTNVVCIERFEQYFNLVGGVNLPKVITCVGSDGKRRKQLVKGRDDLRQDAVMQQIFVLVNRLLQSDPTTSKRQLCVRTYKVIPLSQRSGVAEWCENTRPLGEYLVGTPKNPETGAHSRYRPFDLPTLACRKKMMEVGSIGSTAKLAAYMEITRKFQPVFHHFFMEFFPTPPQWFEKRLAYTRSVAASSMLGYMVGLGDRHVQNILIDTNTAEFIHIDLGVAFEQGKTLPTPETVPFRLTRDIVDGMGIAGVEGVFRRCCEKTMSLMRAHQEELRTIVEVLLHDPLYQWTLSPLKALNLQRRPEHGEDTSVNNERDNIFETAQAAKNSDLNKMAERVLIRLQEKLEGIEDGVPLSINGQVNHLIQEATDPSNLCALFPGWQPWL